MKNFNKEQWEKQPLPEFSAELGIEFCLRNLSAEQEKSAEDIIGEDCSYKTLIKVLLKVRADLGLISGYEADIECLNDQLDQYEDKIFQQCSEIEELTDQQAEDEETIGYLRMDIDALKEKKQRITPIHLCHGSEFKP